MAEDELRKTVANIIAAHGGASRWNQLQAVEAVISVWGFLFKAKRRPVLRRVRVRAAAREPKFTFFDYPRTGRNSEFIGNEEVRITDGDHQTLVSRRNPRDEFRRPRRLLYWDALDFTYFGGYATWNYLVTPFLFMRDDLQIEQLQPTSAGPDYPLKLLVEFPPHLPTHCNRQIFYFDSDYLLRRLDYTAEVVGRWARAAHTCDDFRDFGGLKLPTKRRVLPLLMGSKPLAAPVIVAIDIHDVRLIETTM